MLTLLFWITLYSILVLIFVPLEKIGQWQTKVRAQYKKIVNKIKEQ